LRFKSGTQRQPSSFDKLDLHPARRKFQLEADVLGRQPDHDVFILEQELLTPHGQSVPEDAVDTSL
jgi:hypothetical protein